MSDLYNVPKGQIIHTNSRERFINKSKLEPRVDELISQVVGRKVYAHDPRLLKLIVGWKRGKSMDSMQPDNYLQDPKKIEELKELFKNG